MPSSLSPKTYETLRDALIACVCNHPDKQVEPFQKNLKNWGNIWNGGCSQLLPAGDILTSALELAPPTTRNLVALFEEHRDTLKWEQSYRKSDGLVGDDMLSGYGFVEVVGKNGPFVSERVRTGIGVWGPNINYPVHHHAAEEIYIPLAGHAEFMLDDQPYERRGPEDVVHVASNMRHGFRTTTDPLVVLYVWQAGDLRQTSTFS